MIFFYLQNLNSILVNFIILSLLSTFQSMQQIFSLLSQHYGRLYAGICEELISKAKCPKCFSTKCGVEDLLPNVSLRQAIVPFLESQFITTGLDNDYQRYAPGRNFFFLPKKLQPMLATLLYLTRYASKTTDGESGIQGKDVSCGVSVLHREPDLPHSPSGTGKGSNYIMPDSAYNLPFKTNLPSHSGANNLLKLPALSSKIKRTDTSGQQYPAAVEDFHGESQPVQEEGIISWNLLISLPLISMTVISAIGTYVLYLSATLWLLITPGNYKLHLSSCTNFCSSA